MVYFLNEDICDIIDSYRFCYCELCLNKYIEKKVIFNCSIIFSNEIDECKKKCGYLFYNRICIHCVQRHYYNNIVMFEYFK